MNIAVGIVLTIVVAFFTAILYTASRQLCRPRDLTGIANLSTIVPLMAFIGTLFALLLSFTISNLWNRYTLVKQVVLSHANSLQTIYYATRSLKPEGDSNRNDRPKVDPIAEATEGKRKRVVEALRKYLRQLVEDEWSTLFAESSYYSLTTTKRYKTLVRKIVDYLRTRPPLEGLIQQALADDDNANPLTPSQVTVSLFYVLILTALLTLAGFWFLRIDNFRVQFIIDFIVIAVMGLSFFLIYQFLYPFSSQPFGIQKAVFLDLLAEIESETQPSNGSKQVPAASSP